jgi:hypothetical protein
METGIQLAAIVLGVVPVFRTATGEYRTPADQFARVIDQSRTAISSNRTHEKLEDFLTNLHYELSVLQMAVEKLINELDCLYLEEKDALKKGSSQKVWTDPRVTQAVQDRLGSGYETFQIQVTKLLEQLEKLVAKDVCLQLPGLEAEKVLSSHPILPHRIDTDQDADQRSRGVFQTHISPDPEVESPRG